MGPAGPLLAAGLTPRAGCPRTPGSRGCRIFGVTVACVLRDCLEGHHSSKNKYVREREFVGRLLSPCPRTESSCPKEGPGTEEGGGFQPGPQRPPRKSRSASCYSQDFQRLHGECVFARREAASSHGMVLSHQADPNIPRRWQVLTGIMPQSRLSVPHT